MKGPKTGADETLRAVIRTMESSSDAVLICTAELDLPGPRILYVNRAFVEMTGYRSDEVVGQTPRMFQGPGTSRAELDRMRQALSGQQDFNGHIINYRKSGEPYVVEWHIAPLRDHAGTITHWFSIQRDVTSGVPSGEHETPAQE